jgi:hypothetical protein
MIRVSVILFLVLLVACIDDPEAYRIAAAQMEMPTSGLKGKQGTTVSAATLRSCDCYPAFWGRERVASICQSGPKEGPPPTRGCLYQRGNRTVFDQPLEPQI